MPVDEAEATNSLEHFVFISFMFCPEAIIGQLVFFVTVDTSLMQFLLQSFAC